MDTEKEGRIWEERIDRRRFLKVAAGTAAATTLVTSPIKNLFIPSPVAAQSRGTGILRYGSLKEPTSIDPSIGYDLWSRWSNDNTYDALYQYVGNPARLVKSLVATAKSLEGGKVWQFRIVRNAKFHNGTPVTARDVYFSFKRLFDLQGPPSVLFRGIVEPNNVKVLDDYTIEVRLNFPYAPFVGTLPWLYILNEKQVRANEKGGDYGREWLRTHDAGSGPFTIESYQGGQKIVYRRFPGYWREWSEKFLDGWIYEISNESSTLRLRLERDDLDFTDYLTVDDWAQAKGNSRLVARADETLGMVSLKFNVQRAPTNNVLLRRALAYGFDYDGVVNGLLRGNGGRMYSPLPPGFWGYRSFRGDAVLDYSTNLEKARAALTASGLNPREIRLVYNYVGGDPTQRDYGLILKSSAEKLGINVEVEGLPASVFVARLESPATAGHVNRISMGGDPDPDTHLFPQYHSSGWKPKGAWYSANFLDNKQLDDLLEKGRSIVDRGRRVPFYEQAQRILLEESASIWVNTRFWFAAYQAYVKGYDYTGAGFNSTYVYPMFKDKKAG